MTAPAGPMAPSASVAEAAEGRAAERRPVRAPRAVGQVRPGRHEEDLAHRRAEHDRGDVLVVVAAVLVPSEEGETQRAAPRRARPPRRPGRRARARRWTVAASTPIDVAAGSGGVAGASESAGVATESAAAGSASAAGTSNGRTAGGIGAPGAKSAARRTGSSGEWVAGCAPAPAGTASAASWATSATITARRFMRASTPPAGITGNVSLAGVSAQTAQFTSPGRGELGCSLRRAQLTRTGASRPGNSGIAESGTVSSVGPCPSFPKSRPSAATSSATSWAAPSPRCGPRGSRCASRCPRTLVRGAAGRTIEGVRRHGKFLILDLDGGARIVGHLGMTGAFLFHAADAEPGKRPTHVHVDLRLRGRRAALVRGRAAIRPARLGRRGRGPTTGWAPPASASTRWPSAWTPSA